MTLMRIIAAVTLGILICGCGASDEPDLSRYSVIHKNGKPCPAGWTEEEGKFVLDGKPVAACVNPSNRGGTIDYLRAGESIKFSLVLPDELFAEPKSHGGKI